MPNYVTTTMQVTGSVESVARFRSLHCVVHPESEQRRCDGTTYPQPSWIQFDFETVIPRPAILDGIEASSRVADAIEVLTGRAMKQILADLHPDDQLAQMLVSMHTAFAGARSADDEKQRRERLSNLSVRDLESGRRALQAIEECGYPTWYEWCTAKWGTKWNSTAFELVKDEPGHLVFRFDTAWSTPRPVLQTLAELYRDLAFVTDSFDENYCFATHGVGEFGVFEEEVVDTNDATYEAAYGYPPEDDENSLADDPHETNNEKRTTQS